MFGEKYRDKNNIGIIHLEENHPVGFAETLSGAFPCLTVSPQVAAPESRPVQVALQCGAFQYPGHHPPLHLQYGDDLVYEPGRHLPAQLDRFLDDILKVACKGTGVMRAAPFRLQAFKAPSFVRVIIPFDRFFRQAVPFGNLPAAGGCVLPGPAPHPEGGDDLETGQGSPFLPLPHG